MAKKQKFIVLRVPKQKLAAIAGIKLPAEASTPSSTAQSPAATSNDVPALKTTDSIDQASEPNSTPAPGADASTPNGRKGKGSAAAAKRALGQVNGDSKVRGKPGPKKKPRNEDGTIDHGNKPAAAAGGGAAHKLNPKTNAGAINANLRALDRSGKPCRKWQRKAFSVKSFTGISWDLPSWKGGEKPLILHGDDSSETKDISQLSSSEVKPNNDSDVAMSNTGDQMASSLPPASSPPRAPAQPAAIAAQG